MKFNRETTQQILDIVSSDGSDGIDYSANSPSLVGLNLLAMIPANTDRVGYFIQSQDTNGLTVVMDDQDGILTPTFIVLGGSTIDGGQGGSITMNGMPHTGRIRIYSISVDAQMAARAW